MASVQQSALIVEVPEAEALVANWRIRHDPVASEGIPAHITVLFPFVPPEELGAVTLETLAAVTASVVPFEYSLDSIEEFPGAIWLRPDPDEPFRDLTQRVWTAFPEHPPYEGRFPDSQPHLTIVQTDSQEEQASLRTELNAEIREHLPIRCAAAVLSLFLCDESGRWTRHHVLDFGGRQTSE